MVSHLAFLVLFCLAVGLVLGAILRHDAGDAARLGLGIAMGMAASALAAAWLMYFIAP